MSTTMERLIAVRHDDTTLNASAVAIAEGLRLPIPTDWRSMLAAADRASLTMIGEAIEDYRRAMPHAVPRSMVTDDRSALAELIALTADQMSTHHAAPVAIERYAVERVMATPRTRNRKGASAPDVSRAPRRDHEHRARMVYVRQANDILGEQMVGGMDWQPREITPTLTATIWNGERNAEGEALDDHGHVVSLTADALVEAVSEGWRKRAGVDAVTRVSHMADGSLKVRRGVGTGEPMVRSERHAEAMNLIGAKDIRVRLVEVGHSRPAAKRERFTVTGGRTVAMVEGLDELSDYPRATYVVIDQATVAKAIRKRKAAKGTENTGRDAKRAARAEVLALLDAIASEGQSSNWSGWTIVRKMDRKSKNGRRTPYFDVVSVSGIHHVEGTPRTVATSMVEIAWANA